ncbi:MAG TPA: ubiquinone/menaquinone biosynthesis methyltransferase [Anaerolineales bacterium]|nr:ubiquinone/menaquinone biosynthesis methyltransferase [Anaerolineales bacterium]
MSDLTGRERAEYVQDMFTRIAARYDRMNRLMTFGQDMRWRRIVIRRAALPPGGRLLDLGTGTGDIALAVRKAHAESRIVAADFTVEMMRVGRTRPGGAAIPWTTADALNLPFADASFDAVVSGFLMRNVTDLPRALLEQRRVLKPGGRIVILDTTRPPQNLLSPFIRIHLKYVIPALGKLITGEVDAYRYLPETTQGFLSAEELALKMRDAGFDEIGYKRAMLGTIAIHWGIRAK